MTVSNTTVKLNYNGNGSNRTFALTFPLLSAAHLRIVVTDAAGTETEINNNFSLNTALDTLTYPTVDSGLDPLPTGSTLTLIRQTPLTQEIDLQSGNALDAAELERGYDKLTYLLQEIKEQVSRCIKYAVAQTDITTAEQFLSDITTAAEAAQTSATSAATSATTASTKASQASTSQVLAAGYATDASNYATAASESAASALSHKQDAATSAYEAGQAATAAESAKDDAEAAKSVVGGYKDAAAGYASEASISANAAATSASAADDAKAYAIAAKTAAETAQGKAETAESNATDSAAAAAAAAAELTAHNTSPDAHADMRQEIAGKQAALPDGATGLFLRKTADGVDWAQPGGGGGGGGSVDWGGRGGTLSNQTDLKKVLDSKAAASHTHTKSETTDFPTIPAKVSDLQNDSGFITGVDWDDVGEKPESFTPSSHTHTKSEITDFPTIPAKVSDLQNDSGFITGVAWDDVSNKPSTFTPSTHTHSQYLTAVPVATTSTLGGVKPDGTTITAAADGTLSAVGGGSASLSATYDSTNKILTLE